ncbi:hypothetical protein ONZ45_g911 [Pleurotus djamor]|nr:hypothetical protein ONZ45_g911 [Pleurotus djamor]
MKRTLTLVHIAALTIHSFYYQALVAASFHGDGHFARHKRLHRSRQQEEPPPVIINLLDSQSKDVAQSVSQTTATIPSAENALTTVSGSLESTVPVVSDAAETARASKPALPSPAPSSQTASEIQTITERRLGTIVGGVSSQRANAIPAYLASLGANGKWPDSEVDYTTGCPARRANWPAQEHWQRIVAMAAAWHGGLEGTQKYVKDSSLRSALTRAIDFWFSNDFTNSACIDAGGTSSCPCETPGLWNTNWFSNTILIPELCSATCLLLNDTLTTTQLSNCTHITLRAYDTFTRRPTFLTGANTLDVAKVAIDQGLLTSNTSLLVDAYRRVHNELVVQNATKADGIRLDGSFGQHAGILYNGNYGKDYSNDLLDIETESAGTQFAANAASQMALATLFDGDSWMIFYNALSGISFWDFSALGRFISFPVIDGHAGLNVNLTRVMELGQGWGSQTLIKFSQRFSQTGSNANAATLFGNRMFYANDYLVHRGSNYVTSVKMFSKRTVNTECTNTQNPLGFHLSDGVVHTYLQGNEYEDISAAWDWNLIPGITVDYDATQLSCDRTGWTGVEAFVGGVSTGKVGIAAMQYTNPFTRSLHFQKAWFFLPDDIQVVMISGVTSTTSAPVLSVLDQRRHTGTVTINGVAQPNNGSFVENSPKTLWHGGVGYIFPQTNGVAPLHVQVGPKVGNWSAIGTSTQPPPTVDLFAAYLQPQNPQLPLSYIALPGIDSGGFQKKSSRIIVEMASNDIHISAAHDPAHALMMAVFWDATGGTATFGFPPMTITANGNAAVIVDIQSGNVTVSDPSQTLMQLVVTVDAGNGKRVLAFTMPGGGLAGSSVTKNMY